MIDRSGVSDRARATSRSTVCVVDDDPSVRTALERLFRGAGWTVLTFASAAEFLEQDLNGTCGCVVVDVHLGGMNGLELQAKLASGADPVPVIIISGVEDAAMEAEACRLGAIAFFRKPFDVCALLDSVRRGMAQRTLTT